MVKMINLNADIAEGWGAYDIGNDSRPDADHQVGERRLRLSCRRRQHDASAVHAGQGAGRQHRRASRLQRSVGLRPPPHPDEARRPRVHGRLPDRRAAGDGRLCRPQGDASQGARRSQQHGGRGRGLCDGHRPRHQGGGSRHHLRGAVRLADGEGGAEAGPAAGAGGIPRPPVRRRRQPGVAHHPRHRHQGPEGRGRAARCAWCATARSSSLTARRVKVHVDTLCVHGDEATGVAVARGIRGAWKAPASPSCRCPT